MSRHEGVSCDSCLKGNFRGKRYKCLICYDYDLCATCYEAGATNTRHTTDHPMQCILTRSDFDLYYGGEAISIEQPQSFTCPYCGKMGFTESTLQEHVTAEHPDTNADVVCPICAALPSGEPNHVTDDFASHLTMEHRSPRDIEEPSGSRHVRRIPHPGRGMSSARARRSQMQLSASTGLSSLSPSSRDSMDPIAELLSQLSGARRTANMPQPSTTSQLHQLQMQLQLERQQAQAARQQLERLPRRQAQLTQAATAATSNSSSSSALATGSVVVGGATLQGVGATTAQSHYALLTETSTSPAINVNSASAASSQFLLARCTEPSLSESEQRALECERQDRGQFVQELLLSTLTEELSLCEDWDSISTKLGQMVDTFHDPLLSSPAPSATAQQNCKEESACQAVPSSTQTINMTLRTPQLAPLAAMPAAQNAVSGRHRSKANNNNNNQSQRPLTTSGGSRGGTSTAALTVGQVPQQQQQSGRGRGSRESRPPTNRGGHETGGATSPSSARRKVIRQVDDRNKSSEPPPPPH